MQCNMATTRKRQDDKHLKILRELVSLPANKQCFDCHQRGPTYVNMTIGSYVCTTCSGMLRGLTPPHRVKSISMASFSPEEVESMKARGNEHCRQIWLGLYDPNHSEDTKDEQQIKDFMIAKYEKKRYYIDPTVVTTTVTNNGSANFSPSTARPESRTSTPTTSISKSDVKPLTSLLGPQSKPIVLNVQASTTPATNTSNMFTPDKSSEEFFTDFSSADPFSSPQFTPTTSETSFANFENNPIFNSFSMPTSAALSNMYNVASFPSPSRKLSGSAVFQQQQAMAMGAAATPPLGSAQHPTEDRYAALKDLDCLMKTQTQQQATEPQHVSAAPVSKLNNGFSMHGGSVFGSPSQGCFLNSTNMQAAFPEPAGTSVANPFTGVSASPWSTPATANSLSGAHPGSFSMNPFQTAFAAQPADPGWSGMGVNGIPNGTVPQNGGFPGAMFPSSQSMNFPAKTWHNGPSANPFMLGTSPAAPGHSSNPFL